MAAPQHTELERLRADFANLKRRHRDELDTARSRGRDEIMLALAEVVDDCDRALAWLSSVAAPDQWRLGIEQLRDRAIQRFAGYGYQPFVPLGEIFDPTAHEAVGIDHTPGADGQITAVHRRGWRREDHLIVPAAVVVRSGDQSLAQNVERVGAQRQESAGHVVHSTVRRRRRASAPVFYACPYESPGCQGDCELCVRAAR